MKARRNKAPTGYSRPPNRVVVRNGNHNGTSRHNGTSQLEEARRLIRDLKDERTRCLAEQATLKRARACDANLFDSAPVGYVLLTKKGRIQNINLIAAQLLGRSREQLLKLKFISQLADECHKPLLKHLDHCHTQRGRARIELKLRGDNPPRYVEMFSDFFTDEKGEHGVRGVLVDISERKQAEKQLTVANAELERRVAEQSTLLDILPVGVLIGNSDCRKIVGNPAAYEILGVPLGANLALGVPRQEALKGVRCHVDGEEIKTVQDLPMQRVARTGRPLKNVKQDIIYADGRTTSIHASVAPLFDEKGKVRSVIGAYADITKRDQAEQSIRIKESQLRLITDVAPVMLTHCSRDLKYLYVNQAYARLVGIRAESLVGKPIVKVIGEKSFELIRPYIDAVLDGGRIEYEQEIHYPHIGARFMRGALAPDRGDDGRVMGWVAALLDITEQKREEKGLTASLAITKILAESPALEKATPGILDILARTLGWDASCFYAVQADTLKCQTIWQRPGHRFPEFIARRKAKEFAYGDGIPGTVWSTQKPIWIPDLTKDKRVSPVDRRSARGLHASASFPIVFGNHVHGVMQFFSRSVHPPDQSVIRLLGNIGGQIGQFIERKRSEESLRESEARFRDMADSAPVLIWMSGANQKHAYFNQRWQELTGRSLNQELEDGWAKGVHPQDLRRARLMYETAFALRQEFEIEYRMRRHNGEYVWLLDHGSPRFTPDGAFLGFIGSCIDISGRKKAEEALRQARDQLETRVEERTVQLTRANSALKAEIAERQRTEGALRESEDRFRLMIEGVQDCSVIMLDTEGRVATWNDAARRLDGYREKEIVGQHFTILFSKDDVQANLPRRLLITATKYGRAEHEGLRVRKNGMRFWASLLLTALRDDTGKLRGFAQVTRNFTERRLAEQALQESRGRLQAIMDNSPALIFLKDTQGRYLHCNRQFLEVYRTEAEKTIGRTDLEIFPQEQAKMYRANDRAVLKAQRPLTFDEVALHDDGSHTSIVTKFPLQDERGKIYAIGGVATDITVRLRTQEALHRSEAIMADFFEHAPLGLFWISPRGLITRVNTAGLELLSCSAADCLNQPVSQFFTDPGTAADALERLKRGEVLQNHRARIRGRNQRIHHVVIDANGLWEDGIMQHSRWFVRDITRRVELEREILAASERERQRIGRDLHDDLCQQLTGIEFLCQSLARKLPSELLEHSRRAREIARMIREAITHTRELAHGLSPTPLDSAGLRGALNELAERARKLFKIDCELQCQDSVNIKDETATFHLYRIAQEAVNNAIKHGRARRIHIELSRKRSKVMLVIRDFGQGMKTRRTDTSGMGMRVMQYRAGVIGGNLSIEPTPGGGTTVLCSVPEYQIKHHQNPAT